MIISTIVFSIAIIINVIIAVFIITIMIITIIIVITMVIVITIRDQACCSTVTSGKGTVMLRSERSCSFCNHG